MTAQRRRPIRVLTAVPICDGHDSAINTINLELIRHGVEVVYLGYHRSARDIVRAAIQEDVRAVGISSYNGGHVKFFGEVIDLLEQNGARDIRVFGGGGGTISTRDASLMQRRGVDRIFFAGTPLDEVVKFVLREYGSDRRPAVANSTPDRRLARLLTRIESADGVAARLGAARRRCRVIGITGPGGAGKTTLIDELVLRLLASRPEARIAILSHDPSIGGNGALLGDRAAMIHSQHDRVFMRSFATRGRAGGLSAATRRSAAALIDSGPDVVLIETVGIGQEAVPFGKGLVDKSVLVMSPDYGARLQLQKIAMLDAADIVVLNKSDLPGAPAASSEIQQRLLSGNPRDREIAFTCAKRHRDPGVDHLLELLEPA
jgi:methylmalonyl-CoA mutase